MYLIVSNVYKTYSVLMAEAKPGEDEQLQTQTTGTFEESMYTTSVKSMKRPALVQTGLVPKLIFREADNEF